MLDIAPNSITIHDDDGNFHYANKKTFEIHGYTQEEFMKLNLHDIDIPESAELIQKRMQTIREKGNARFEVEHYKKDGTILPLEIFVKLVNWKGSRAMLSIATDITERRKMFNDVIAAKAESEKSNQFYKATFEKAAVGIAHVYPDGTLFKVNDKFCEITGYSSDELRKMNFSDITYPEDLEKENVYIQQVLSNKIDSFSIEKRYKHKKGHLIWVVLYSNVVRKSNGIIEFAICTISDITARKNLHFDLIKSKQRLEESEAKLKLALKVAKIGYWRYEISSNKVEWSDGHERLFGIPIKQFGNTLDSVQSFVHPEDRGYGEDNLKKAIEQDIPFDNTYRVIYPNKDVHWLHSVGIIIKNGSNVKTHIFGVTQDITEQIIKERELTQAIIKAEESEYKVRNMFENTQIGIIYCNSKGKILEANPAILDILGSPSLEESKRINLLTFRPLVEVGFSKNVAKCIKEQKIITEDIIYTSKWGKTVFMKYYLVPVIMNKKVKGVWVNLNNLTDLWNTQKELITAKDKAEESDRLKTEFLRNISHEVRTPLNGIIGFSKLLNKKDLPLNKRSGYSAMIQTNSQQLLKIIDSIVEISFLETKQEKIHETVFCLNELCDELYSNNRIESEKRNLFYSVVKNHPKEHFYIKSDRLKIKKILNHLIENALRFTNKGQIELGYQIKESNIVLYVKDTGIGISEKNQKGIFDRFVQEEKEISKKTGGLGLGLSISKAIANLLGGDILLESEKGKGSTFYLILPYKVIKKSKEFI
jgi:PAS domain S-box-containing protein